MMLLYLAGGADFDHEALSAHELCSRPIAAGVRAAAVAARLFEAMDEERMRSASSLAAVCIESERRYSRHHKLGEQFVERTLEVGKIAKYLTYTTYRDLSFFSFLKSRGTLMLP